MTLRRIIFALLILFFFTLARPFWAAPNRIVIVVPKTDLSWALSYSPDGKFLVSIGMEVRVWELKTGKLISTIPNPNPNIHLPEVAWNEKNHLILCCHSLSWWDVESKKKILEIKPPGTNEAFTNVSADGQRATITDWSRATYSNQLAFTGTFGGQPFGGQNFGNMGFGFGGVPNGFGGFGGNINGFGGAGAFGGNLGSFGNLGGQFGFQGIPMAPVRVWNTKSNSATAPGKEMFTSVPTRFSPNRRYLLSPTSIWNTNHSRELLAFLNQFQQTNRLPECVVSPSSRYFAILAPDRLETWELESQTLIQKVNMTHEGVGLQLNGWKSNHLLGIANDGSWVALLFPKRDSIHFLDTQSGKSLHKVSIDANLTITASAMNPQGTEMAYATSDGQIRFLDLSSILSSKGETYRPNQFDLLWKQLLQLDASKTISSMNCFRGGRDRTVADFEKPLLEHLGNQRAIDQLIADLDHPRFVVREKATRELMRMNESILPQLRLLEEKSDCEDFTQRLRGIMQDLGQLTNEDIRFLRALTILEQINTKAAQELVEKLARHESQSLLTQEATASFTRMRATTPKR